MTRFPTLFVVQICPINHSDTNIKSTCPSVRRELIHAIDGRGGF